MGASNTLAVAALVAVLPLAVARQPNFVFVLTDDQDLLLNGTSAMPVLQSEIVSAGLSLTGFVDVPVCCPSRTSTLTGRYSHNLNNTEEGWCGNYGKQHEGRTWIHSLKAAGYETALFGKVGSAQFGDLPARTLRSATRYSTTTTMETSAGATYTWVSLEGCDGILHCQRSLHSPQLFCRCPPTFPT